jgi:dephospho-CoA kinase
MKRDNATEEQVRARMSAQMDDEEKRSKADFVLMNDGIMPLDVQLDDLVRFLKKGK